MLPFRAGKFFRDFPDFLHRPSGARELPQAGSPFPGGEFFAEPQRWGFAVCGRRDVAAPAAGAKRKDNLRFSFLFELLPFPCVLIRRRFPICDRFENRERQRIFSSVFFATCSQGQIPFCYTGGLLCAGRGICEYNLLHNISCRVRRPRRTVCKFICRRITVGANNVRPHHR